MLCLVCMLPIFYPSFFLLLFLQFYVLILLYFLVLVAFAFHYDKMRKIYLYNLMLCDDILWSYIQVGDTYILYHCDTENISPITKKLFVFKFEFFILISFSLNRKIINFIVK